MKNPKVQIALWDLHFGTEYDKVRIYVINHHVQGLYIRKNMDNYGTIDLKQWHKKQRFAD